MSEGIAQGGGKALPPEYRPDAQMLDEYYRALMRCVLHMWTAMVARFTHLHTVGRPPTDPHNVHTHLKRVHRMQELAMDDSYASPGGEATSVAGGKLHPVSAQVLLTEFVRRLEEALTWSKMAAHLPAASVYSQLIRWVMLNLDSRIFGLHISWCLRNLGFLLPFLLLLT